MTVILPVRLGDRPRWATDDAVWTMAENLSDGRIGGVGAEFGPPGRYPRRTGTKLTSPSSYPKEGGEPF